MFHSLWSGSEGGSQADYDRKAPAPIDYLGRLHAAHAGLYGFSHVSDVQPVAGDCRAVEVHLELHGSGAHADGHVLRAAYGSHDTFDLVCLRL